MKRKRAKQKHHLTQLVLLILAAFFIGVILWINRSSIMGFIQPKSKATPARRVPKPPPKEPQKEKEEIREQERKDLDNILKRR